KFMTATSSNDGEFETSTTTCAPLSTSASPSPVSVLTPVLGAAATASCPIALSLVTSFDPIGPVPPITTIFMLLPPSFLQPLLSPLVSVSMPAKTGLPSPCNMDFCQLNFGFLSIRFQIKLSNSFHKSTGYASQVWEVWFP